MQKQELYQQQRLRVNADNVLLFKRLPRAMLVKRVFVYLEAEEVLVLASTCLFFQTLAKSSFAIRCLAQQSRASAIQEGRSSLG